MVCKQLIIFLFSRPGHACIKGAEKDLIYFVLNFVILGFAANEIEISAFSLPLLGIDFDPSLQTLEMDS